MIVMVVYYIIWISHICICQSFLIHIQTMYYIDNPYVRHCISGDACDHGCKASGRTPQADVELAESCTYIQQSFQ